MCPHSQKALQVSQGKGPGFFHCIWSPCWTSASVWLLSIHSTKMSCVPPVEILPGNSPAPCPHHLLPGPLARSGPGMAGWTCTEYPVCPSGLTEQRRGSRYTHKCNRGKPRALKEHKGQVPSQTVSTREDFLEEVVTDLCLKK